jgi:hypothetical protein
MWSCDSQQAEGGYFTLTVSQFEKQIPVLHRFKPYFAKKIPG